MQAIKSKKRSNAMAKALKRIFLKSPTITAIRKATILKVALSQKTSYSLSDLHVGDC